VTHDPQIARRVDRVVAIRDGRTSTETIRRVSQLEQAMVGDRQPEESESGGGEEVYHEYVVLDSAGRLQVPREYLEQLGIGNRVTLDLMEEGIVIRPVAGREAVSPLLASLDDEEPPPPRRRRLRGWWSRRREGKGSQKRAGMED
jgi:hypothetical protein